MTKEIKSGGCQYCKHVRSFGRDYQCKFRPYDYQTAKQKAIVHWMRRVFSPWTYPGCPEFVDDREEESGKKKNEHS